MSHEHGRERHMMYKCERCSHAMHGQGFYNEAEDEYWCGSCVDNANEAAWERHQESLMENGPGPSLAEQQAAARKFK
jgi:DNA-directed RNA polymerase subunit RPC12/RpoP